MTLLISIKNDAIIATLVELVSGWRYKHTLPPLQSTLMPPFVF
ncbi:hypothetical protein [Marinibactrum halimedae]|nr:hypothetical protein [Marinibactrum halimedae]